ncbi:MAG TPA: response regulator [Bryobacteraceae bacterium]|jgi:CheY-like chemotaxis protein|nr:response regulator [Bryobacteraceae bacterium]
MSKCPIAFPAKHDGTATILIVDDEQGVIEAVCESLRDFGFSLITTTDPHHALSIIRGQQPLALLITDLFMPSMNGARLLKATRKLRPRLGAVVLTGIASEQELLKWRRRGEHIVAKPWPEDEFITTVTKALAEPARKHGGFHAAN